MKKIFMTLSVAFAVLALSAQGTTATKASTGTKAKATTGKTAPAKTAAKASTGKAAPAKAATGKAATK